MDKKPSFCQKLGFCFWFPNSVWEPIHGRGASLHSTRSVVEGIPKQSSRLKFF